MTRRSVLEDLMEKELKKRKIEYIKEYSLPILKTSQAIRADFYLINEDILIELDGIQHFQFSRKFHKSKKNFLAQIDRDCRFDEYALANGFRVLHISFLCAEQISILLDAILENEDEIIFSDPELYENTRSLVA